MRRSILLAFALVALVACVAATPLERLNVKPRPAHHPDQPHPTSQRPAHANPTKPQPHPAHPHPAPQQPPHKPAHQPAHQPAHPPAPKPHHHAHEHSNATKPTHSPATDCSFNGLSGTCQSVSSCDGTSIAGKCPGGNDIQCCIVQPHYQAGCGKAAIERAMTWVNMQLQYCQSPNGQPDGDSDCSSVCHRSINKAWDPYRSDCSAFVSYAYGLPAPGRVTSEFAPFKTDLSFTITPEDLEPGDPINSVPAEHIMLFVRWLDADRTSAELLEEPGCSANPPYARVTRSAVRITDGKIFVEQNGMTFQPIRFRTNSPIC